MIAVYMQGLINKLFSKRTVSSTKNADILLRDPIPLYSKEKNLALFWSAKSGCTYAVKWFFYHAGLLDTALSYNPWVHDFREQVYSVSSEFKSDIKSLCNKDIRAVKVVRNPYSRAVSSYLMAVRAGYDNNEIGEFLGRTVDSKNGFSFSEFLNYLASIDLRNCNIHHRLQVHPAEEEGIVQPLFVIHLENSFQETAECEKSLGLATSDLHRFRASGHNTSRRVWPDFWGHVKLYRRLGNKILPDTENFYDDSLKAKVGRLYSEDFKRYGYCFTENINNSSVHTYRDSDDLLTELKEQLPISGPGEPACKAIGYWPDSWCGAEMKISVKALDDITGLTLVGCLPGQILTDNTLELQVDNNTTRVDITNTEDFRIYLPVRRASGSVFNITISSGINKSGLEVGYNSDRRKLSFFLKEIILS
jgi:hypothetical protein